jgi:hypothetical protein
MIRKLGIALDLAALAILATLPIAIILFALNWGDV